MMNESLSQSEIDELINNLTNGEKSAPEKENSHLSVKKYNFRKPNKFTKDQLRTLYMINENFSRIISNFLSGYLRSTIDINIASVEQTTYEEFLVSILSTTLLTVFQMEPLSGNAVFEFSNDFTSPAIDLLFGGMGKKAAKIKELTEIEIRVLRNLIAKLLENMAMAWSDVFSFTPVIDSMETNPQFNQVISPNETVAIVTFAADVADNHSVINLCLPYATLKEAIPNLTAQRWFATKQDADLLQSKDLEKRLEKVSLDITARCGEVQLTIQEFLQLEEGDVVLLNTVVGQDMDLLVEGQPKYKVQPGILSNKVAVIITGKS